MAIKTLLLNSFHYSDMTIDYYKHTLPIDRNRLLLGIQCFSCCMRASSFLYKASLPFTSLWHFMSGIFEIGPATERWTMSWLNRRYHRWFNLVYINNVPLRDCKSGGIGMEGKYCITSRIHLGGCMAWGTLHSALNIGVCHIRVLQNFPTFSKYHGYAKISLLRPF